MADFNCGILWGFVVGIAYINMFSVLWNITLPNSSPCVVISHILLSHCDLPIWLESRNNISSSFLSCSSSLFVFLILSWFANIFLEFGKHIFFMVCVFFFSLVNMNDYELLYGLLCLNAAWGVVSSKELLCLICLCFSFGD